MSTVLAAAAALSLVACVLHMMKSARAYRPQQTTFARSK